MKHSLIVTGADGFVGRNLIEHFSLRPDIYHAIPLSRTVADLQDERAVRAFIDANPVDNIIHCATIGGTRKTSYDAGATDVVSANLRMFFNLVRSLKPGMRLITMGSGAEYDLRAYKPKMPEEYFDVNVPADPYGFSKYLVSKYIQNSKSIVCLRVFGLFGKYENYAFKFISNAIVKNLLGLPIIINQNVRFDYLYIEDLVRIVGRFIGRDSKYSHYNVTTTESIDLVGIAELINRIGDKQSEINILNPGLNDEYTGSNNRLLSEFPDLSFTPYESAIRGLYSYYRDSLSVLDLDSVKADSYLKSCRTKPAAEGERR